MRRAFDIVEIMLIVVILAIAAGITLPKYFEYRQTKNVATCQASLGVVRARIFAFTGDKAMPAAAGGEATVRYPTYDELVAMIKSDPPTNPFNKSNVITVAVWNESLPPIVSGSAGWCYDPVTGNFWANSNEVGEFYF